MKRKRPRPSSHLFTVRLWVERLGGGQMETRCKVQHVLSGETRYFRQWPALLIYLTAKVGQLEQEDEEGGDI
jgi:hypothetical protein